MDTTDSVVASVVVVCTEAMLAEVNICLLLNLHYCTDKVLCSNFCVSLCMQIGMQIGIMCMYVQ